MNKTADKSNVLVSLSGGNYAAPEITPDRVNLHLESFEEIGESVIDCEDEPMVTLKDGYIFAQAPSHSVIRPNVKNNWLAINSQNDIENLYQIPNSSTVQSSLAERISKALASRVSKFRFAELRAQIDNVYLYNSYFGKKILPCEKDNDNHYFIIETSRNQVIDRTFVERDAIAQNDTVYPKLDEVEQIRPLSEATTQRKRRPVMRAASIGAGDKEASMNVVMGAARRVMRQHSKELKALANK